MSHTWDDGSIFHNTTLSTAIKDSSSSSLSRISVFDIFGAVDNLLETTVWWLKAVLIISSNKDWWLHVCSTVQYFDLTFSCFMLLVIGHPQNHCWTGGTRSLYYWNYNWCCSAINIYRRFILCEWVAHTIFIHNEI